MQPIPPVFLPVESHGQRSLEGYSPWGRRVRYDQATEHTYSEINAIQTSLLGLPLLWKGCCCLVTQSCLTLCDPMNCSTPGFPVLYYLPEVAQAHVHWVNDAIQPSHLPFSFCLQSFPESGSFPTSQLFTSGGQSTGASAPASVLPMNIQDWFPLGLIGLISLQSNGLKSLLQHHSTKALTLQLSAFFMVQHSHPYMITGKMIALTI